MKAKVKPIKPAWQKHLTDEEAAIVATEAKLRREWQACAAMKRLIQDRCAQRARRAAGK